MRKNIGWRFQDAAGVKWQAVVHFHAGELVWTRQARRFDQWETFTPTDEWWEALIEEAERFVGRGKITVPEYKQILRRGAK